ncbi:hypothetical protein HU200_038988 [Digitaria exilis]|uniref:F-box domain-containing protein n=1 Tax=Digitaria exilis TaxID=1010633 RepID=A0A835BC66_9POAL|nr:hypothetical protein HU200_038988 [Digitaria exilis]
MGNHIHKARRKERGGIREPPDLPLEILLDIFARADPATVIRCAAASKLLRRHITDPSFHQHLRNNHAEGFVPGLLVGVLFFDAREGQGRRQFPTAASIAVAGGTRSDRWHRAPVSSSSAATRSRTHGVTVVELCVGNPVTGEYAFLPPATVLRTGYSHVLLTGDEEDDDATSCSRSFFRLLVLDTAARAQTFSSRTGEWGPVTEPFDHLNLPDGSAIARCSAVVLRGVAHWLYEYKYNDDDDESATSSQGDGVVAITIVGAGTAATAIEIPRRFLRWRRREVKEELLLARSGDGRLALLVVETLGIAMWTMSDDDSTSRARRLVVDRQRILRIYEAAVGTDRVRRYGAGLVWGGERHRGVTGERGRHPPFLLLLNLLTEEISQFSQGLTIRRRLRWCPYEMDLLSLLTAMKSFWFL